MTPLLLASFAGSAVNLIVTAAIVAVVIAAIIALLRWARVKIPQPVWIVLWALLAIFAILFLAKLFSTLL